MGIEYDEKGKIVWKVGGKKIPRADELGATAKESWKKIVKNVGVVKEALGELARDQFSSGTPKGKAVQEKILEKEKGKPASMKKGGTVKKTGYIKMHKGEKVIPAKKKIKRKKRK